MLQQRSGRKLGLFSGAKFKRRLTLGPAALVSACSFASECSWAITNAAQTFSATWATSIIRGEVECGKSGSTGSRCTSVEGTSVEANLAALVVSLFSRCRLAEQVPVIAALSRFVIFLTKSRLNPSLSTSMSVTTSRGKKTRR
uniref:(northern house mosquito) hypothetical protein n=1 Tax=Culex pipiens TaxID=7175 RepID=A0A8D8C208_CULPI